MSRQEERGYIAGRARLYGGRAWLYLCNEFRGHCVSLLQSTACTATLGPIMAELEDAWQYMG